MAVGEVHYRFPYMQRLLTTPDHGIEHADSMPESKALTTALPEDQMALRPSESQAKRNIRACYYRMRPQQVPP